jgi:two-component system response regulator FixJ
VPSAMRAGQLGVIEFIEKPFRIDRLLAAAQGACELLRSRELSGVGALHSLTPREKQLLISLGDGAPNKVVAHNLGLSVRTVEVYRANMIRKLGVRSLTQAVLIAREGRLL